uniref:GATA-type domain-containing protein n=1 Tax=Meloidogyne enterolobii TaxID=390850 RepID=A0A6V7UPI9_MELEN|nr:unnamed protein product [Meloidogyne enterolobii]
MRIELKIKDDWEEKREFIYLKNVELKERFVVKTIEKKNNFRYCSSDYNMKGFLHPVELNLGKNNFNVHINDRTYIPAVQLRKIVLIEIANNEIIQRILPECEKRALRYNNFTEENNFYETSILEDNFENTKIIKKELLKENIESYKNILLSSYWTEINLIGYKIELLEKQKVEYPKKLEKRIIYIGNKISGINERNKRKCFNCRVKETRRWHILLKEHSLCEKCGAYKRKYRKFRSKELCVNTIKIAPKDHNCSFCDVTHTSKWYRYSIPGHYLCAACYGKQRRIKKSTKNTKADDRS